MSLRTMSIEPPRYTPTTCFETFPFPESSAEQAERIAEAARELDRLRTGWLNPPEWTREEVLEFYSRRLRPVGSLRQRPRLARHRHGPLPATRAELGGGRTRIGQTHAHQSLQPAPHLAGAGPPKTRLRRHRRLRLARLPDRRRNPRKAARVEPTTRHVKASRTRRARWF